MMGYHCINLLPVCLLCFSHKNDVTVRLHEMKTPLTIQVVLSSNEKQVKLHQIKQCSTATCPNMPTEGYFALELLIFSSQISFPLATGYILGTKGFINQTIAFPWSRFVSKLESYISVTLQKSCKGGGDSVTSPQTSFFFTLKKLSSLSLALI